MKKYIIATSSLVVGVVIAASACSATGCRDFFFSNVVSSFDECKEQGFPIIAGDPDRCVIDDTTIFIAAPSNIKVTTPTKDAVVDTIFTLSGKARALDNVVFYSLLTSAGTVLAEGSAVTDSPEHGQFGFYKVEVAFEKPDQEDLQLEVYSQLPDGSRQDVVRIPLKFGKAIERTISSSSNSFLSLISDSSHSSSIRSTSFDPLPNALQATRPTSVRLDVPFTPQAPFANWDPPFNEACEEASLLMAVRYSMNEDLTLNEASNEITEMVDWQTAQGYAIDISTDELAIVSKEYYNLMAKVYTGDNVSIESIESLINAGYPVIIPAAGQMLGNPYFLGAGPPYHMLVITGYDANSFFTNDPGTKRGEDFTYTKEVIMNAIHDWNGSVDTIESGKKALMVVEK